MSTVNVAMVFLSSGLPSQGCSNIIILIKLRQLDRGTHSVVRINIAALLHIQATGLFVWLGRAAKLDNYNAMHIPCGRQLGLFSV